MTTAQKDAIVNKQAGAVVYDTDINALSFFDGSNWVLTGNSNDEFKSKTYLYSELPNDVSLLNNGFSKIGYETKDFKTAININSPAQTFFETSAYMLGRSDVTITSIPNNKFVVWGGKDALGIHSDGAFYDAINDYWEPIPDMADGLVRNKPVVLWANNKLLIYGGTNNSNTPMASGKIYNPITNEWSSMNTLNGPGGRTSAAYGFDVATNQFVVWGGQNASSLLNTGAKYDIINNIWTPTSTTNAPTGRARMGYGLNNGKLFIFGGFNENGVLNEGYNYDVANNAWSAVPPSGLFSGKINDIYYTGSSYIVYGPGSMTPYEGAIYNTNTNSWTSMNVTGAPGFTASKYLYSNGYFIGSNGGAYNINTDTWGLFPPLKNALGGFAGNDVCLLNWGGATSTGTTAAFIEGGERYFWNATPVFDHENKILRLYLYKKN